MEYYQDHHLPASREEMFQHLNNLLNNAQLGEAQKVLQDLASIENISLFNKDPLIPEDDTYTPVQKLKALISNPASWIIFDPLSKDRYPTPEAISVMRTLDLTHEEPLTQANNMGTHKINRLLGYSPNWDISWAVRVRQDIRNHHEGLKLQFVLAHTSNMELVRACTSQLREDRDSFNVGDGSNLDDETLQYVLGNKFYSVAADPRVTEEQLLEIWREGQDVQVQRINLMNALLKNPNTPSHLIEILANMKMRGVLEHPNLTARAIEAILPSLSFSVEDRLRVITHPLVPTSALRKLAKSKQAILSSAAQKKLAEQAKELPAKNRLGYIQ